LCSFEPERRVGSVGPHQRPAGVMRPDECEEENVAHDVDWVGGEGRVREVADARCPLASTAWPPLE
jgi:hypothetical protein